MVKRQRTSRREKKTQIHGGREGLNVERREYLRKRGEWHKRQVWEGRGCGNVHLTCPSNCLFKDGSYPLLLEVLRTGTPDDTPSMAK